MPPLQLWSPLGEGVQGEVVDDGNICDRGALWQGHEDVAPSFWADGRAVGRSAGARGGAVWPAQDRLERKGDARPVHSTTQNLFQNVMVQRKLCDKRGASHDLVGVRAVEGGSTAALHDGGEAKAVSEAVWNSPFKSSGEWEGIHPGRCGAAGTAEELGSSTQTVVRATVQGGQSKASAPALAERQRKALCASAIPPKPPSLTT
jgi:hypothetical protein